MSDNPKAIVEQAYNNIADWYLSWVENDNSPRKTFAEKVLDNAPQRPHILELGCGPGVPITRMLLDRGAHVTANDISAKQIEMARCRCPEATFRTGDMATLSFQPDSFDGVTCFYTIFHLPRAEQKDMLRKIHSWLKPGAMFVANFATFDEEAIYGEQMGYGTFWSSFGAERNKGMLEEVGFELVEADVREAGDGKLEEGDPDYGSSYLWVSAKKKDSEVRQGAGEKWDEGEK